MTLQLIQDGNRPSGSEWMNNWNEVLNISGKNLIRTLIDRSTTFSSTTDDWFAEAYVDADGRLGTVNTASSITTAVFNTNKYSTALSVLPTATSTFNFTSLDSTSNASYFYDNSLSTAATTTGTNAFGNGQGESTTFGKLFTSELVTSVYIKASGSASLQVGKTQTVVLEKYNGSSWTVVTTISGTAGNSVNCDQVVLVNDTIQGLRLTVNTTQSGNAQHDHSLYGMATFGATENYIVHTIPSTKFSSSISKSFLTTLISDWSTDSLIQYKLTNASEDTGWLNCDAIASFTAFTSTPTTLTIKLVSSSTGPIINNPGIYGVALRAT